jgi:hypothetical protein
MTIAMVISLAALLSAPKADEPFAYAVRHGERLSVRRLDSSLPSVPLKHWIERTIGQRASRFEWESSDCGESGGGPRDDWPLCVDVYAHLTDGRRVILQVWVGTQNTGLAKGKESIWWLHLDWEKDSAKQGVTIERLGTLARWLRETDPPTN